jgi:hypothetical protein
MELPSMPQRVDAPANFSMPEANDTVTSRLELNVGL